MDIFSSLLFIAAEQLSEKPKDPARDQERVQEQQVDSTTPSAPPPPVNTQTQVPPTQSTPSPQSTLSPSPSATTAQPPQKNTDGMAAKTAGSSGKKDVKEGPVVRKWYFWVTVLAIAATAAAITGIAIRSATDYSAQDALQSRAGSLPSSGGLSLRF